MCGIVGYIGKKNAYNILINGLKRLEYRGYDSSGIALSNGTTRIYKKQGKISNLEDFVADKRVDGNIGIAHTRWATHGEPSDENAHPHQSQNGKITLVHNGIIENYAILKERLEEKGYTFQSQTDTEVLANLIEYVYNKIDNRSLEEAVRLSLEKVVGAYGIIVMCDDEPKRLVASRKGSPLVIGVGDNEYYIGSDATPLVEYTNQMIYLQDFNIAIIEENSFTLKTIQNNPVTPEIKRVDIQVDQLDKGGYEHYMLKEIYEQPTTIEQSFKGRIAVDGKSIVLGGLIDVMPQLVKAPRIIILGCGTSWHAGLVAEYLIETYCRIPVEVEYASEFRYRTPVINKGDVIIAVSQSGETADTLAAIKKAKEDGAIIIGVCNVVGSSIPRETHAGVYTHAGVEIGVASTKAFTAQVTVLTLMAIQIAKEKGSIDQSEYEILIQEILEVPNKVRVALSKEDKIKSISDKYSDAVNALYLGRGYLFPVALEGALKLKEVSYIHAEGYAAGEMKHGPIALVDDNLPVVAVAPKDHYYEKVVSNIQEVKARKGNVIAVLNEGDLNLKEMVNDFIEIPSCHPAISPLVAVIPLQLLAYHIALNRGCDVDQPRNLAKSVTVE
ncbi:glutamine--fructose-6-phosphate transaminase (isomerizing) [Halosquirtibacter laminarini]|uniref:Glutamine--fructose-6-phosphate transaminase (Isomerizing) n=1 Tax=Halosquirtibacter laminarini TaxID=3374600 RepID=A0AC61NEZ6_9BACT|nr:glutamine--fructose-6-phosphate transaminase (isomerizing) [Prolixibacteraceae bacterium]